MPAHFEKPISTLAASIPRYLYIEQLVFGQQTSRTITSRSIVISRITASTFTEFILEDKKEHNVILSQTFMNVVVQSVTLIIIVVERKCLYLLKQTTKEISLICRHELIGLINTFPFYNEKKLIMSEKGKTNHTFQVYCQLIHLSVGNHTYLYISYTEDVRYYIFKVQVILKFRYDTAFKFSGRSYQCHVFLTSQSSTVSTLEKMPTLSVKIMKLLYKNGTIGS